MATLKIKNNKGEFEKVPYIIGGITQTDLNQLETNINNSINSINNNIDSKINNAVLRTGDTLTGALNFPNTTLNLFGDDCYLGDQDIAGQIAIKGNNGNTGITFLPYSGNISHSISIDGGGTMTITGNALRTPSIDATLTGSGQFRAVGGNYGFLIRNDGVDSYFLLTDPGDPYGSWNNLRPIVINNATGKVRVDGDITGNAETVKGRDVCAEIDSLKQSVVSGKQAVVDAINNKLGYASGLTTSHSGADYAWWIENQIGPSPNNVIGCSITKSSVCSNSSSMPKAGVIHVYGSLNKNITVSVECISGEFIIIPEYSMVNGSKNSNPVAVKLSVGQKYTFGVYQYGTVIIFLKRSHIKYHTVLDSSNMTCDVNRLSIG